MKKSLFALAAVTAFAGAAQAQSSVTVYGILDAGFSSLNQRQGGPTRVTKSTTASLGGSGNETTSRLGFKGTEDLGGGTSAFFTVEVAITPNSAQNVSTGTTSNRQTFVGLKKNGIGQFALGTQYTPVHVAVGATDPGQTNNVVGNVIYPNAGTTSRDGQTTTQADGGTFGYVVRTNNALTVTTDKFAGFQGNLFYTQNNANTNQTTVAAPSSGYTGGHTNQSGYGLGVNYNWQKLLVTANYQSFKAENPYTQTAAGVVTTGTPVAWGVGGASAAGVNTKDNNTYFAATYDFGILKAYAQYLNRKVESTISSNNYMKRSAQQIGVRSFITPTIEAWGSIGNGRISSYGPNQPTANFTGWQIGSNYLLSKRTNLYAIYGQTGTSNVASVAGTGNVSTNANQYAVGVRHTF